MGDKRSGEDPPADGASDRTPPICRLVGYFVSKFREYHTKKKQETAQDRASRRSANATILIACFTIVLAIISALQWRALNVTNADFESTQRSFVVLSNFEAGAPSITLPNMWQFFPVLENGGNTAATDVAVYAGEPIETDAPVNRIDNATFKKDQPIVFYMAPKSRAKLKGWEIPSVDIEKTGKGPFSLYIWGIVFYKDDITGRHVTRFCNRIIRQNTTPSTIPTPGAPPDVIGLGCLDRRFTCADEDCKKYDALDGPFPALPSQ